MLMQDRKRLLDLCQRAEDAASFLQGRIDKVPEEDFDDFTWASMVEAARSLRTISQDLTTALSSEALDAGVSPQTLDWNL